MVQESAHEDANIIFGLVTDPNMEDVVKVTVIATGFDAPGTDHSSLQSAYQHAAPHYAGTGLQTPGRAVSPQHAVTRNSVAQAAQSSRQVLQPRAGLQRPARTVESQPRHGIVAPPEPQPSRAFGASAIHDEAVLDIPAYLRRARS
jgi:cell division protein FtsZ